MAEIRHFCSFTVDGMLVGIDVRQVREVIRSRTMTPVPLADPAVAGLINLRGEIVTGIDLRTRLGLARRPDGAEPMHVVIRLGDGAVSLMVDEIGEVIEAADVLLERPPETLAGPVRRMIAGVCQLPGRLLVVLDIDSAFAFGAAQPSQTGEE